MADVIRKATNKFSKGLIMDFSPENTQNEVLTHALNATLLTFNGNEMSLQNDMGNGRVETAFLPEGYIPVGTCEHGGIIYIVSYNPLEDKSQIGCFPSPERNITSDELGLLKASIEKTSFQGFKNNNTRGISNPSDIEINKPKNDIPDGTITNSSQYVLLRNDKLNPGDKFIVTAEKSIYEENLADLFVNTENGYQLKEHPILKLSIVSIEDSGKIIYLNSDLRKYEVSDYKYHILGQDEIGNENKPIDIDDYRNVLSSGYNVFKSKTSGKLAILAELIMIDSYSVTHGLIPRNDGSNIYDIVIYSEISPELNNENYNINPKLKYYHLENSQCYLQKNNGSEITLFNDTKINNDFFNTKLSDIYSTSTSNDTLKTHGKFNFPKKDTYHSRMNLYTGSLENTPEKLFTKFSESKYHRIKKSQIINNLDYYINEINAKFYYYNPTDIQYKEVETNDVINDQYTYYTLELIYVYHDAERNTDINKTLYELISIPSYASDAIIDNKNIEKYQYINIYRYRTATKEEVEKNSKTFYVYDPERNEYTSITGTPNPELWNIYYVKEEKRTLKSVGKDINKDEYKEDLYYFPGNKEYIKASQETIDEYYNFTLHPNECPITLYYRTEEYEYKLASEELLNNYSQNSDIKLYYDSNYIRIFDINAQIDSNLQWFIVVPMDQFISFDKFKPNSEYNKIIGYDAPEGEYPKDDYLELYTVADFIPSNVNNQSNYLTYDPINLGSIKIPDSVSKTHSEFPFKYDYTLVPCMNYGKLSHLATSNTINFNNLWNFGDSEFTTWKYRIDGNQLRLTFGAEILDTFEKDKVDALILEFYDHRGFAGSIEIIGKKSYSGIFTKIIELNSLNAISKNRIINNKYSNTFKRNVNIIQENDQYKFNNKSISYNYEKGWDLSDSDNDCGTLYSNLIYGVKTYIRRTIHKGTNNEYYEFIPKKELFLFTLPIYNDYYHKYKNFDVLENPKLKLALTYKLEDAGNKQVYNENNIENGYNELDKTNVDLYFNGQYQQNSLNVTKYYKYSGSTNLYLDVGLHSDYNLINIKYNPEINEYFKCDLKLTNFDSDKSFTIESDSDVYTNYKEILNYSDVNFSEDINYLKFDNGTNNLEIKNSGLRNHNYLNNYQGVPIKINYNFIVGYKAFVEDMVSSEIQTNTICALFHKNDLNDYNYEDFGIYKDIENDLYLSNAAIYNSGSRDESRFGICKQVNIYKSDASSIQNAGYYFSRIYNNKIIPCNGQGKLNTNVVDYLKPYIGKLTFCQPHVHCFELIDGVNIYHADESTNIYGISRSWSEGDFKNGNQTESSKGTIPTRVLYDYPKYNMCLNTKSFLDNKSEFISTIPFDQSWNNYNFKMRLMYTDSEKTNNWSSSEDEGFDVNRNIQYLRLYTGVGPNYIQEFNKLLLNTMKNVYAYNPDYNTYTVKKGKCSLQKYSPKFISNIVCTNSRLDFSNTNFTLNNFVGILEITFAEYLNDLKKYSEIEVLNNGKFLPKINFDADFTYCGASDQYYLISSLTYNTPPPNEIINELEFDFKGSIIKHHDGSIIVFPETIENKNCLYGYDFELKKLIQLDVSNYYIESNGTLKLKQNTYKDNPNNIINITPSEDYFYMTTASQENPETSEKSNALFYNIRSSKYPKVCLKRTSITLNDLLYDYSSPDHRLYIKSNNCWFPTGPNSSGGILYYRKYDGWYKNCNTTSYKDWQKQETNRLFLYSGPCFTSQYD